MTSTPRIVAGVLLTAALGCGGGGSPASAPDVTLTLNATSATITQATVRSFSATVSGSTDTGVTWSVREAGGGAVNANGSYTAPATTGTFHLVATSHANPAISATAALEVVAPPTATSFASSKGELLAGQSAALTAVFANGTGVVDHGVGAVVSGTPVTVTPTTSTVYVLTVTNAAGTSVSSGLAVTVDQAVAVGVLPSSATVVQGQLQDFQALVTGTMNVGVTWSVQEAGGGTIDAQGHYTAPLQGGTFHVVATSAMDVSKTASATVVVPAIGWGISAPILTARSFVEGPRIAADGRGNAIAVWIESAAGGTETRVWANRYSVVSGWDRDLATPISEGCGLTAADPQIAIDDNGNALAVWLITGTPMVCASTYDARAGWFIAERVWMDPVAVGPPSRAATPRVAFDGSGNAIAVWRAFGWMMGSGVVVIARRYTFQGWVRPGALPIEPIGLLGGDNLQLAVERDGRALAIWDVGVPGGPDPHHIWASAYVPGTGWEAPVLVESETVSNASAPDVAFDGSGNALAVWLQGSVGMEAIWSRRYLAGSGWGTAAPIDASSSEIAAAKSALLFDGGGNAMVAWVGTNGSSQGPFVSRYDAVSGWAPATPLPIIPGTYYTSPPPSLTIDAGGAALAVWAETGGRGQYWLRSSHFAPGTGWTTAVGSVDDPLGSSSMPSVTFTGAGKALAVWRKDYGGLTWFWGNEFH